MARSSFIMRPTKTHINKYLLLILCPPILLLTLNVLLVEFNILPPNRIISNVLIGLAIGYLLFSAIFFLIKKQRTLEIKNHAIRETDIFGNTISKIKVKQIHYTHRNILDELLLFDNNDNLLLCVCPHLENRILFDEWLMDHGIRC